MKTIVLTGASGFLGQHLLKALLDLGHHDAATTSKNVEPLQIWALHHSKPELQSAVEAYQQRQQSQSRCKCSVECVDLTCQDSVQRWLSTKVANTPIDVCIHTAALSAPAKCEADPDAATALNVPKTFFNCLFMHSSNPVNVIALSTDQVYCGTKAPYTEDDRPQPCNHYGRTKLELEEYLLLMRTSSNLHNSSSSSSSSIICLRSSIILGPQAPFVPAHSTFLHFCATRRDVPTTYFTDEIRSVIAVQDVVQIILACCGFACLNDDNNNKKNPVAPGVYCMGGPQAVSRYDMAVATLQYLVANDDITNSDDASSNAVTAVALPALKAEQPPGAVASPLNIAMDSSRLVRATGMADKMKTLPEMVKSTFAADSGNEGR